MSGLLRSTLRFNTAYIQPVVCTQCILFIRCGIIVIPCNAFKSPFSTKNILAFYRNSLERLFMVIWSNMNDTNLLLFCLMFFLLFFLCTPTFTIYTDFFLIFNLFKHISGFFDFHMKFF